MSEEYFTPCGKYTNLELNGIMDRTGCDLETAKIIADDKRELLGAIDDLISHCHFAKVAYKRTKKPKPGHLANHKKYSVVEKAEKARATAQGLDPITNEKGTENV